MSTSIEHLESQVESLEALGQQVYEKSSYATIDTADQFTMLALYSLIESQRAIAGVLLEILKELRDVRRLNK